LAGDCRLSGIIDEVGRGKKQWLATTI